MIPSVPSETDRSNATRSVDASMRASLSTMAGKMGTSVADPGPSIESARRTLAAQLKSAGNDEAELDARMLMGAALGLDLTGMIAQASAELTSDEAAPPGAISPAVDSRANRSPAFSARRNSGGCRCNSRPRRWCRGPIPRRWSNWRCNCCAPAETSIVRCASPISAPAPARSCSRCCPRCRRRKDSGPTFREAALQTAGANAARAGLSDRATFIACDYASGLTGPFDLIVSKSALYPLGGYRWPGGGGAESRSPGRARRRRRRAGRLPRADPQAAGLLAPGAALVVEAGEGQSAQIQALMTAAGLMPAIAPKADLAGIPRAVAGHKMAR